MARARRRKGFPHELPEQPSPGWVWSSPYPFPADAGDTAPVKSGKDTVYVMVVDKPVERKDPQGQKGSSTGMVFFSDWSLTPA